MSLVTEAERFARAERSALGREAPSTSQLLDYDEDDAERASSPWTSRARAVLTPRGQTAVPTPRTKPTRTTERSMTPEKMPTSIEEEPMPREVEQARRLRRQIALATKIDAIKKELTLARAAQAIWAKWGVHHIGLEEAGFHLLGSPLAAESDFLSPASETADLWLAWQTGAILPVGSMILPAISMIARVGNGLGARRNVPAQAGALVHDALADATPGTVTDLVDQAAGMHLLRARAGDWSLLAKPLACRQAPLRSDAVHPPLSACAGQLSEQVLCQKARIAELELQAAARAEAASEAARPGGDGGEPSEGESEESEDRESPQEQLQRILSQVTPCAGAYPLGVVQSQIPQRVEAFGGNWADIKGLRLAVRPASDDDCVLVVANCLATPECGRDESRWAVQRGGSVASSTFAVYNRQAECILRLPDTSACRM
ncbi:unnamed protein product [Prorocentrum cordatum]|uniref:Uncharacterized protein n=1 Tax=Prorocentrum cordatum TaxID=2364126 RepID=A0ABN9RCW7_9DINO|nr:unnamed protein product [Polarella glacialis]